MDSFGSLISVRVSIYRFMVYMVNGSIYDDRLTFMNFSTEFLFGSMFDLDRWLFDPRAKVEYRYMWTSR